MKYYVLGTQNNTMLLGYVEKYYMLLLSKLEEISKKIDDVNWSNIFWDLLLLWKKNKILILNWDNSARINFLYSEYVHKIDTWIEGKEVVLEWFLQEVSMFLSWNKQQLSMNLGTVIANTSIHLTHQDNNPYAAFDAHPEHAKNWWSKWYWDKTPEEWLEVYNKTFDLLKQVDKGIYSELNMIISKIVPLGTAQNVHNSASYKECIGHLYMWYTIGSNVPELNNLEAVIHESSHNKLNIIRHFDQIITSGNEENYYSPYRPDARHINGVYLWLHAFVPVVYILMKTYAKKILPLDEIWLEKITLYYIKNKITYKVLKKYGKFTPLWQEILDEMYKVMCMTDKIFTTLWVSKDIILNSKQRQIEHFSEVNKLYPHLEY